MKHRAEELVALLSEDQRNRSSIEEINSHAPLVWVKDRQGAYIALNDEARHFLGGMENHQIAGRSDETFFSPDFCRKLRSLERAALNDDKWNTVVFEQATLIDTTVGPIRPTKTRVHGFSSTVGPWYSPKNKTGPEGTVHVADVCTESLQQLRGIVEEQYNTMLANAFTSTEAKTGIGSHEHEFSYAHDLDGNIISLSANLRKLIPASLASATNIRQLVHDKDIARLDRSIERNFSDITVERPVVWRIKNKQHKKPLWLAVFVERVDEGDRASVVGRGWVIGASTLNALQRNSRIIRGGKVAGWDREIGSNIFFVSDEWKAILGLPAEKVVTFDDFKTLVHPDDRARVAKTMSSHLSGLLPYYETIYRIKHDDGDYRWIQAVGQMSSGYDGRKFVSGCNFDVSHEMQAASDLAESDMLLRTIVDADPAMIFLKDSSGRFVFANHALCKFYSCTTEDVYKKTDSFFFEDLPIDDDIEQQLEKFRRDDETILRSAEGRTLEIEERIVPPGGNVLQAKWFKSVSSN